MTFVPPPGYCPSYNPTLPFNEDIPGGLEAGMTIDIEGVASKDTKRFVVNFAVGPEPGADIAFHFKPCFEGWDKVVFNSQQSDQWEKEEKKNSMPFKKGEPFQLLVMVMEEHFQVLVNGSLFYEFVHRIPLQKVTHLHVDGDLKIHSVNVIAGNPVSNKIGKEMYLLSGNLPAMEAPPIYNPPVPFVANLQGGLTPNRTIVIRGFISHSANRIAINFNVGTTGDIALHINPRIPEGIVVRNTFQNGAWGPEERDISYNPFRAGQYFDVSICAGSYGFQVFASGQYVFDYRHRMLAFSMVNILQISGDVILSYVQV